jgi:exopolysaccharide production protein ExoQ
MTSLTYDPDRVATGRLAMPALIALLLVAFVAGGGGSWFAFANLLVQLTAIVALAVNPGAAARFWRESPLALRLLMIATVLLPLIQTIPLPPALWTALPGRALAERSLELAGADDATWMPMSLDPRRTLLALTALITPIAVLVAGWTIPRDRLILLGWLVVALGLVTVLLGTVQLGATDDTGTLFGARSPGQILLGTFANRNSTGLFQVFALALAAMLPAPRPLPAVLYVRLGVGVLLLLGIVLTRSRTALVLAMLPLMLAGLRALWWWTRERAGKSRRGGVGGAMLAALGALGLAAAGVTALVIAAPGQVGTTLERFEAKDDPRRFIWDDATYSVSRYWPAGAGMGTFDEVFQIDESLENLTKKRAGRAHNDYIELAIEAGPLGLALAAAWAVLIGWLSWRARRSSGRWTAWAGSTLLLAIALQSVTDYPLRSQTMLAFAGFALLLLARFAAASGKVRT